MTIQEKKPVLMTKKSAKGLADWETIAMGRVLQWFPQGSAKAMETPLAEDIVYVRDRRGSRSSPGRRRAI